MTRILYEPGDFHMRIEGHSGYAPAGEDLVCAVESALSFTLAAAAAEEAAYRSEVQIDEGRALVDVRCSPEEEARSRCRYMFDIIARGFELLAADFAQYVSFEQSGE